MSVEHENEFLVEVHPADTPEEGVNYQDQRLIIFILTYADDSNKTVFFDPENQVNFPKLTELVNNRIAEEDMETTSPMPEANDVELWDLVNEMADQLQSSDNDTVHLENPDMHVTIMHVYDPRFNSM